ncbi:MAG: winged helix-turn-helix domain-containing protein [Deltaproteobacteria bacterium]|jgi:restriction endonuclease Mrr|nr:winged helix-turn-helix domain-containing protein [Deltaproteobacteria bacterium]
MPFPSIDDFILPVLELADACPVVAVPELRTPVTSRLGIPKDAAAERLPFQKKTKLDNMLNWSLKYLLHAGLLERKTRFSFTITVEGREALKTGITYMPRTYLTRYPSFMKFHPTMDKLKDAGSRPPASGKGGPAKGGPAASKDGDRAGPGDPPAPPGSPKPRPGSGPGA